MVLVLNNITNLEGVTKKNIMKAVEGVGVDSTINNRIAVVGNNIRYKRVDIFIHSKNFIKDRRIFYSILGKNKELKRND